MVMINHDLWRICCEMTWLNKMCNNWLVIKKRLCTCPYDFSCPFTQHKAHSTIFADLHLSTRKWYNCRYELSSLKNALNHRPLLAKYPNRRPINMEFYIKSTLVLFAHRKSFKISSPFFAPTQNAFFPRIGQFSNRRPKIDECSQCDRRGRNIFTLLTHSSIIHTPSDDIPYHSACIILAAVIWPAQERQQNMRRFNKMKSKQKQNFKTHGQKKKYNAIFKKKYQPVKLFIIVGNFSWVQSEFC